MNDYQLVEQFKKDYDITIEELNKMIQRALNSSASIAVKSVKDVLKNQLPNLSKSSGEHGYTRPLLEGVQKRNAGMKYVNPYSAVTILGTKKGDDGTWRLRFFSTGTVVNGTQRIQPHNFWESGLSSAAGLVSRNIELKLKDFENIVNDKING